ncbi:MAG: ParA family protein [Rhodobacteraceae bacterium]|nr:ParA family protein [Paracoccaceae bacterium]
MVRKHPDRQEVSTNTSTNTIALFNNKGGVGKTSLLYHLAHMFAYEGLRVVAADLDPQANLTGMFLDDSRMEALWSSDEPVTMYSAMRPLMTGTGDVLKLVPEQITEQLFLLPGDLRLSEVEDELSTQWPMCLSRNKNHRAFRVTAAFHRMIQAASEELGADIALIDVGPNLGAINRCALVAADHVVIPIGADLFSIQGLQNVGRRLRDWRKEWADRRERAPGDLGFHVPPAGMRPIGYVVSRYSSFAKRATKAFQRWLDKVPKVYADSVLQETTAPRDIASDPNNLAQLKDYRSLMPMAQEARKPMFLLKSADGVIGGHQAAVQACFDDFQALANEIRKRANIV